MSGNTIQMKKYIVNFIQFNINENFRPDNATAIKLMPTFNKTITKVNDNTAVVKLGISIAQTDYPLPFTLSAAVSGVFELENWAMDAGRTLAMEDTALIILYPYLRALVSNVTANASIPPYFLPIINIVDIFRKPKTTPPINTTLQ